MTLAFDSTCPNCEGGLDPWMIRAYPIILSVVLAVVLALMAFTPPPCQARVYIDITSPHLRKIPTAVPQFKNLNPRAGQTELVTTLADLLAETIAFTGFFKILDRDSFLEDSAQAGLVRSDISFKNWTDVGAELLVKGGLQVEGDRLTAYTNRLHLHHKRPERNLHG